MVRASWQVSERSQEPRRAVECKGRRLWSLRSCRAHPPILVDRCRVSEHNPRGPLRRRPVVKWCLAVSVEVPPGCPRWVWVVRSRFWKAHFSHTDPPRPLWEQSFHSEGTESGHPVGFHAKPRLGEDCRKEAARRPSVNQRRGEGGRSVCFA